MRAKLGRFGLEGQHHLTPICKLSGGQKARVVFTAISLQQPHILLLDEPTNHLDMQACGQSLTLMPLSLSQLHLLAAEPTCASTSTMVMVIRAIL